MINKVEWKSVLVVLAVLGSGFFSILGTVPVRVSATELYVGGGGPGNYTTIQAAVNAAVPGDTVYVYAGIYIEDVYINKRLSLIGQGREVTTVVGAGTGSVITIDDDDVVVKGFHVMGSGPGTAGRGSAIEVREDNRARVAWNFATTSNIGILAWRSVGTIIENNLVSDNNYGIVLGWGGDPLFGVYASLVANNSVSANSFYGIEVRYSQANEVSHNAVIGNPTGIRVTSSQQNRLHHNDLVDNTVQASDNSVNIWNESYPSGGNHWSDYTGGDVFTGPNQDQPGTDGIGDTPRPVQGGTMEDRYPLKSAHNLPGPPQNPAAIGGDAEVTLTWDPPASPGSALINNYSVYRGPQGGTESLLTTLGKVLTYVDTGLVNGLTYYYKVSALNDFGEGVRSTSVNATPMTFPGPPTNLVTVPADRQVTLTWSPPASDGGSQITNYSVWRGTSPGDESPLIMLDDVLTYADTGLTNGITYYYKVIAKNAIGEGSSSEEVNATPATTPSEPLGLDATAGDGQVTLTWAAPSSDGGFPVTNYSVFRRTASGGEILLVTLGNVLTYTDTNVVNGQTYYYKVTATNMIGEGPKSIEASATPSSPTSKGSILEETWFWALIIVLVVGIIIILLFVMRRGKGKGGTTEKQSRSEGKS